METTTRQVPERYDLLDSLEIEWIKLPIAVMRDRGPAVQTLGGLLKLTNRETYAAVAKIAACARLPTKTVRNHLAALTSAGWINNVGRQRTRGGAPRRTCTIKLATKTTDAIKSQEGNRSLLYGVLPWWACLSGTNALPWCAKAVLSVVMARLMAHKAIIREQDGKCDLSADDLWGSIANLGGEDRFRFSLKRLEELTGLDHKSIVAAKIELRRLGVIHWLGGKRADGGHDTHMLYPNEEFRVVVTTADGDRCIVKFERDGKTGR